LQAEAQTQRKGEEAMTLTDRIATVCPIQARRFDRLTGTARTIATGGIYRHFDACDRYGVEPDKGAIREIIDDALAGRAVYLEVDQPLRGGVGA
jgi:hypothetical protein